MFYPPFLFFFVFIFIFLLFLVFGLVKFGLFTLAFARLGIPPEQLFSLFFLCIVGSMINIPIRRIALGYEPEDIERVSFFGMRFHTLRWRRREMVLAVNVGGAIIPTLLSLYLLTQTPYPFRVFLAIIVVSALIYKIARPVPGVGIATPVFIPPLVAALIALLLTPDWSPPTAYVAGTLGTLIGADILNLNRLKELQTPVASIGGAGTFDGIFLTGILAVVLA
jgi:uncharacterized membrane protein